MNSIKYTALETEISKRLIGLGLRPQILGFTYLREAISLSCADATYATQITRKLYPEVAKKYGSSMSKVERAIRHAISTIYRHETNSEFIANMVEELRYAPTTVPAVGEGLTHTTVDTSSPNAHRMLLAIMGFADQGVAGSAHLVITYDANTRTMAVSCLPMQQGDQPLKPMGG